MGVVRDPVTVTSALGTRTFNVGIDAWLDVMEEWDDTAPLDIVIQPNGIGDGAVIAAEARAKEKPLTLGGAMLSDTRSGADALATELAALFPRNAEIAIERFGRRMFAWLYDSLKVDLVTPRGFRWTAPLLAVDPFKYGTTLLSSTAGIFTGSTLVRTYTGSPLARSYSGSPLARTYTDTSASTGQALAATIVNDGNERSRRVTINVTGPLIANDWRIVNESTGESMTVAMAVDAGRTLVIDSASRTVTLDGVDVTDRMHGSWISVQPGVNTIRLLAGTSNTTASMTVTARAAWR